MMMGLIAFRIIIPAYSKDQIEIKKLLPFRQKMLEAWKFLKTVYP